MLFLVLIVLITLFLYVLLIARYAFGWSKIRKETQESFTPQVSIVIAIRNEQSNIVRLLKSLQSQIYDIKKLEVILVNDHSTDNTFALLNKTTLANFQILNMPEERSGKKDAIRMGVSKASGDIILVSDADCIFTPDWVKTMVSYFANHDVKLVSGPVSFNKQEGVFQSFQALEFASLIGSGAGAIGIKNAIFCNGANMAYRKEVFMQGYNSTHENIVSGDDVFLLHSVKEKHPKSIAFAKYEDAIVTTDGMQSIKGFINQRKRWVAKSSVYKDRESIYVSYLILFTNIFFVFLFMILFFDVSFLQLFALFYVIKFIVDSYLIYPVLRFIKREDLAKWIFFFELIYSFYITLIVILSFTKGFEWKGRVHKK